MAKGNFIEYVISDNPNKYPNDGEQGGYYYRKVVVGTVEDVTPEVTAQTPLVTQILEGLVGKAQGANATADKILEGYSAYVGQELVEGTATKSGLYVWKKYQVTNATINITQITDSTANPIILQFSSNEIDFTTFDFSRLIGLSTTYSNETYSYTIKFISTTSVLLNGNSYSMSWNAETAQMTISASFGASFEFAPIVKDFYDFIDFVVSDSETEYPDGGEQDGYWYEKFQLEPTLFGYTKISVDKFTFANDIGSQEFVTHNLGDVPKMAIIIGKDVFGGLRYMFTRPEIEQQSQLNGYIFTLSSGNYSLATSSIKFNVDANRLQSVDYAYGYQGGMEYTLITMA